METKEKMTSTPFYTEDSGHGEIIIRDNQGHYITGISYWDSRDVMPIAKGWLTLDEAEEHAAFIVRACNNHEALLEAAFALINSPGWRNFASREFTGLMDDLTKAVCKAQE